MTVDTYEAPSIKILEATKVIESKRSNFIIRLIKRLLLRFREVNFHDLLLRFFLK